MAAHAHHHDHSHGPGRTSAGTLARTMLLILAFGVVEAVGGWLSGSLALISDAGHMVSDAGALALAAVAARVALRPPSHRHSFGLGRADVLSGIVNAVFMLVLTAVIIWEALRRMQAPVAVNGGIVVAIGAIGLVVNIAGMAMLGHGHDLNTRGARLHVLGDLLGSIAAVVSGVVIYLTGWLTIDPILSLFIALLIVVSALRMLGEALHVVMEGVPGHLELAEVGRAMAQVEGVFAVHDLHIWNLSSDQVALSAHVVLGDMSRWDAMLEEQQALLSERFDIDHITLQPELVDAVPVPLREIGRGR